MQQSLVYELAHRFIIGALVGAVICALWWLPTGDLPPALVVWIGAPAVIALLSRTHKRRQRREAQDLTDLHGRPAFGDGDSDE